MLVFHATLHARPQTAIDGPTIELAGQAVNTLDVPREDLGTPLSVTFEAAETELAKLQRMFIEPDGSFVWVSPHGAPAWQIDGQLFDRDGKLLFVDLKGDCPAEQLDQLLSVVGWPTSPVMFQLTREAVIVGELEFRRWATIRTKHEARSPAGPC